MQHHVLELGDKGLAHATRVLTDYLPGLSTGVQPLGPQRLLVPGSTMRALQLQYGKPQVPAILAKAGAVSALAVDDSEVIALLRTRDTSTLPTRPRASATIAGFDWHLARTGVPQAWALMGGPDAITWGSVRVGHVDTGYTRHPAFGFDANPWLDTTLARTFFAGSSAGLDDPGPGNGIDPLAGLMDGHGTRTASVICGHAPAAAGGAFYGVAPKVPLVPVRIANVVLINHAQNELALAIDHLIDHAGVGVISLSMGIFPAFKLATIKRLRKAIDKAYEAGAILVCAAGNHVNSVVSPAKLPRTLTLAGVSQTLLPWGGSSYGPEVDVSGPADGIRRAEMRNGKPAYRGGGDGTSYATAMTAGAAALWLAHHGSVLSTRYPQPWQRVEAFKSVLLSSAQVPGGWQVGGGFGSGVIDVHRLLLEPLPAAAANKDQPASS